MFCNTQKQRTYVLFVYQMQQRLNRQPVTKGLITQSNKRIYYSWSLSSISPWFAPSLTKCEGLPFKKYASTTLVILICECIVFTNIH